MSKTIIITELALRKIMEKYLGKELPSGTRFVLADESDWKQKQSYVEELEAKLKEYEGESNTTINEYRFLRHSNKELVDRLKVVEEQTRDKVCKEIGSAIAYEVFIAERLTHNEVELAIEKVRKNVYVMGE